MIYHSNSKDYFWIWHAFNIWFYSFFPYLLEQWCTSISKCISIGSARPYKYLSIEKAKNYLILLRQSYIQLTCLFLLKQKPVPPKITLHVLHNFCYQNHPLLDYSRYFIFLSLWIIYFYIYVVLSKAKAIEHCN